MVGQKSSDRIIEFINLNKNKLLFILIMLLGLMLRILFIDSREITYDDAFSYFLSRQPLPVIIGGTAADTMPPLYYFLLHFWMEISKSLWFLRLLNVIINLATIIFVHLISKELFNEKAALISVFFFAISPFQIYHSQELRMYSLLLLGQVGFFYSVLKIILIKSKKKNIWLFLSVVFGAITMYSHNLGIVGLMSINVLLLFRRKWKIIRNFVFIQLAVVILTLPWLYYLPQQINKVQSAFWTQPPGILEVIQSFLTLFAFLPMPVISIAVVLVIILQIFVILIINIIKSRDETKFLLFLFFLVPPILLIIMSYIVYPVFVPRIFIVSTIWMFILLAILINETWVRGLGKINFVLFSLACVISLVYFYQFNTFPRSQFRNLASTIQSIVSNGTPVIHDNKLSFFPTMFYHESNFQFYLQDEPGSPNDTLSNESQIAIGYMALSNIDEFLDNEEVIFVVFQDALDEYKTMNKKHPVLNKLELIFQDNFEIINIGDIEIFHFGSKK